MRFLRSLPHRRLLNLLIVLIMLVAFLPVPSQVQAVSNTVVISQVYGGGGNSGAPYTNDFVELFNRGTTTVSLSGWSIQYTSATGSGNFGSSATAITPLTGSIGPGQYLLVQEASNAAVGAPLPSPDVTDSTPINMSGSAGKVALTNTTTGLACNGSTTSPCSSAQLAQIVDLVGWGSANFFEGAAAAPGTTNTTAVLRNSGGCVDTDNNSADFTAAAPNPRNSSSAIQDCSALAPTSPSGVGAASPATLLPGDITLLTVKVTPGTNPASTGLAVTGDLSAVGGSSTQAFFDDGSNGDQTAGDNTFSYSITVPTSVAVGAKSLPVSVSDAQSRSGSTTISLAVAAPVKIHDIQGAAQVSPLANQTVLKVPGIVTALRTLGSTRGFYMQDPNPDSDPATSEGIFVFTGSTSNPPALVSVGDAVLVNGKVSEFRPAAESLTVTEITSPTITKVSSGNALPAPVVLGTGGLIPPSTVIENDATGNVETSGVFDPANDGIDFYESLEDMRVQVNDAQAVGPSKAFTGTTPNVEIPVVGDNGANATTLTPRGGVIVTPGDFNPERIILNDMIFGGPQLSKTVNVGDKFPGATVGIMDYSFGNFKLEVTQAPDSVSGGLTRQTAPQAGTNQLSVASFNLENLAPGDPASKYETLAGMIVQNLQSPDLIAVEEIQDNSGATDNGVVDANDTYAALIAAIQAAGGPVYDYRQVNPVNDQDGGAPGGNIRVGFLFRTDRGLSFIDRPGATPTTANAVVSGANGPELLYSPGRIDPTNPAFNTSRKPLAGEFMFNGHHLFAIANHFNSKGGDDYLFGLDQPPVFSSEVQRAQQAAIVHDFVNQIVTADPNANVVVLGDLNDFQFSGALATLKGTPTILNDLIETLPVNQQYTYVYEGNSEVLDHILISNALFNQRPYTYQVVHVNSEFWDQASDHEPQVVDLTLNDAPTVSAGGPYTVVEGQSVTLTATGSDPENGPLTYAWDLDNNGTFETPGQTVTFTAGLDAPSVKTVKVQVTDNGGLTATAQATINVIFNFSGFFRPVDNPPAVNQVKAGQAVPVKFSLNGNKGLDVLNPANPQVQQVDCTTGAPIGSLQSASSAGNSGLSYDPVTQQYTYVWKTDKAWSGTCRQLIVTLTDGTTHTANFSFK